MDWFVVRNRVLPLASRNARDVHKALETSARQAGFQTATGLSERVIYREFFPIGLTAFDSLETSLLGVKPTMSHVLARQEVRQLIASVHLLSAHEPLRTTLSLASLAWRGEPSAAAPSCVGLQASAHHSQT